MSYAADYLIVEDLDGAEESGSAPLLEDEKRESLYKELGLTGPPNMWARENIGLYCQFAAAGLLYGMGGTTTAFCIYHFEGDSNVCSNAQDITFFAWNVKLIFAIVVDCVHPFGYRRRSWFLIGFSFVLLCLLVLAIFCDQMSTSVWLTTLMLMQLSLMFATVSADGYSIEMGEYEDPKSKGQILVTGQRIFFIFCVVAGVIQTLLVNGPSTNDPDCEISIGKCWSWGLTVKQYYWLIFTLVAVLTSPMVVFREITGRKAPPRPSFSKLLSEIWATMHNLTTLRILIFVIGIGACTNFTSQVNIFLQYYIINVTNVQAGIDNITSYLALVFAIYIFQTYFINKNWRYTQYVAVIFGSLLGLLWIPAYFNSGGTRNAWYTIFIDLDQSFVNGLTQVIYSLAVMELAKPGQEATTYELVVTVGNAASVLSDFFATQLLGPFNVVGCINSDDDGTQNCPNNAVNLHSTTSFVNSNGPMKFTYYCLFLCGFAIICTLIFTPYLPKDKAQCHEWQRLGDASPSTWRPYFTFVLTSIVVLYGFTATVLLLNESTACLPAIGGSGCD